LSKVDSDHRKYKNHGLVALDLMTVYCATISLTDET